MKYAKPLALALVVLASLTLTGCFGAPGEVEEQIDTADEELITNNALNNNALNNNALNNNALNNNALNNNALNNNALNNNALVQAALTDSNARQVFKYIVSCALPGGKSVSVNVDGTTYTYNGALGLAPEWGNEDGVCDQSCQEWVSACVLARVNYLGETVQISLRGDHPGLAVSYQEMNAFTKREATYYGNIFTADKSDRHACLPFPAVKLPRVCGPSLDDCVVDVIHWCEQACDSPTWTGAFRNCGDQTRVDGSFPEGTDRYKASITIYLKP